jgi:hypothetical protein
VIIALALDQVFNPLMCQITCNSFTCTKSNPIHLLVDHTYPVIVCSDRDYAPQNLNRYCVNVVKFIKPLNYECELCLLTKTAVAARVKSQKEEYMQRRRVLEEQLEKKMKDLEKRGGGVLSR